MATAGADTASTGQISTGIDVVEQTSANTGTPELGPILETAPDSGVFELDMVVRYTDGPASTDCPSTNSYTATDGTAGTDVTDRFAAAAVSYTHLTLPTILRV